MAIGRIPEPGTGIPESIIAAKGDILTGTANDVPAVITAGANETRLVADSSTATGLKYVADTTNYAIAAKGDLLVGTAADTLAPLTVGTNGHTLVADSAAATGLKWAAPAGGGKVLQVVYATTSTNVNVASTTYADTGVTATITPTSATSTILIFVNQQNHSAGSGISQVGCGLRLLRSSTTIYTPDNALKYGQSFAAVSGTISGLANMASFAYSDSPATTSATTYKVQGATNNTAGGGQTLFQESSSASNIVLMEIGA